MSREASLSDLRLFYGELQDEQENQVKFRQFIAQEKWKIDDFVAWLKEAIDNKWSKEFQDIVIYLGSKLGFEHEFGTYTSIHNKIPFDGLWKTSDGSHIVIECKLATWISIDISQLAGYLEKISKERNIRIDRIFGLYVVGDPSEMLALTNQIRGSKHAHCIRSISCKDLLTLVKLHQEVELESQQTARLLLPFDAVNVGELVQLIDSLLKTKENEISIADETPKIKVPISMQAQEEKELPIITRIELKKLPEGEVILCPSKPEGVQFLLTYNAWGFVKATHEPRYLALYVSAPASVVKFFAVVDKIVDPKSTDSPISKPEDFDTYAEGKKLILLKTGSLRKLEEPIVKGSTIPYSLRYYSISKFVSAKTTDDLD